jgi:hypothetical protein
MKHKSITKTLALLAVTVAALSGCAEYASHAGNVSPSASATTTTSSSTDRSSNGVGPSLDGPLASGVLAKLTVKGKAAATGYDRNDKFGNGWKDPDGNKCDARQDILSRDMTRLSYKDAKKCTVASGRLADQYTGKTINWKVNSGSVDIDHAVALKNAWISGAQKLPQDQRVLLANDPLNLMASEASANRSKGYKNAAEWLPPHKSFRCQYVATQISVKLRYSLSVTQAEKDAMSKVLRTCPKQKAAKVTVLNSEAKTEPVRATTSK